MAMTSRRRQHCSTACTSPDIEHPHAFCQAHGFQGDGRPRRRYWISPALVGRGHRLERAVGVRIIYAVSHKFVRIHRFQRSAM
jgi:hypothetical protein